jgi:hypothetical protein
MLNAPPASIVATSPVAGLGSGVAVDQGDAVPLVLAHVAEQILAARGTVHI